MKNIISGMNENVRKSTQISREKENRNLNKKKYKKKKK